MSLAELKKEAKSKKTSPQRLEELARHSDTSIHLAVAGNPNANAATLIYLSSHGRFNVLKAVARNPNTPETALLKLFRHKQATVREAVLSRFAITAQLAEAISQDLDSRVRDVLVTQWNTSSGWSETTVKRLIFDEAPQIRQHILRRGMLREYPEALEAYVRDSALVVRQEFATLPKMELLTKRPDLVELLANDPEPSVRVAGLRYENPEIWEKLLLDRSPAVLIGVLQFLSDCPKYLAEKYLTKEYFERLAKESELSVRMELVKHVVSLPESAIEILAEDENPEIRKSVFRRFRLTLPILNKLSLDPEAEIRHAVARSIYFYSSLHHGTTDNDAMVVEILNRLSRDTSLEQFLWVMQFCTVAEVAQDRLQYVLSKLGGKS